MVTATLNVAPVDRPVTVKLVEVSAVTERETRFTDSPCIVIERFLSSSFKNTGVVAPTFTAISTKSSSSSFWICSSAGFLSISAADNAGNGLRFF